MVESLPGVDYSTHDQEEIIAMLEETRKQKRYVPLTSTAVLYLIFQLVLRQLLAQHFASNGSQNS